MGADLSACPFLKQSEIQIMSEETSTIPDNESAAEETNPASTTAPGRKKASKKKSSKKKSSKKKASKKKASKKKASKKKSSKKKASKKVSGRGPGRPPAAALDETAPPPRKKKRRKKKASKKVSGRGPGRPPSSVSDAAPPVARKKKRRKKKTARKTAGTPTMAASPQARDTDAERRVVEALDALREALGELIRESRQKDEAIELIRKGINAL
jgi:hypothetical protein